MRMTIHEIVLIGTIVAILLVGAGVKHFRDAHRLRQEITIAAPTPQPTPPRPPYLRKKKR